MLNNDLIGISPNIKKIKMMINKIADAGISTMICGETGVGKEVVARKLYEKSDKSKKPFVKVNCAALPTTLAESELFGYEKGAFTGASRRMRGKFELAKNGILFLDEIGDMPFELQSKMLHALQDGEFIPLGAEKTFNSNAWVIAATNHDLKKDIEDGQFRRDLYYRLSTVTINVAPLRERPEDIPLLIDYYAQKYSLHLNYNQGLSLSENIVDKLTAYHWPGNVRELQNLIGRMIVMGGSEENIKEIIPNLDKSRHTPQYPSREYTSLSNIINSIKLNDEISDLSSVSLKNIKKKAANCVEKAAISYVLERTGWNRKKTAEILGMSYRSIFMKMNELDISPSHPDPDISVLTA